MFSQMTKEEEAENVAADAGKKADVEICKILLSLQFFNEVIK